MFFGDRPLLSPLVVRCLQWLKNTVIHRLEDVRRVQRQTQTLEFVFRANIQALKSAVRHDQIQWTSIFQEICICESGEAILERDLYWYSRNLTCVLQIQLTDLVCIFTSIRHLWISWMVAMYAPVAPKQATTETFSSCLALWNSSAPYSKTNTAKTWCKSYIYIYIFFFKFLQLFLCTGPKLPQTKLSIQLMKLVNQSLPANLHYSKGLWFLVWDLRSSRRWRIKSKSPGSWNCVVLW
jgi:hypothetical protein